MKTSTIRKEMQQLSADTRKAHDRALGGALRIERDLPKDAEPALIKATAALVGSLAGYAFASRELWYDLPPQWMDWS